MKEETILVIVLGLFLLLLFLVGIASDAVATAVLPLVAREERVSGITERESGRLNGRTVRE